jgi:hypothetical protein
MPLLTSPLPGSVPALTPPLPSPFPHNSQKADLVSVLRKMGYTAAANVTSPDGCVVADVAVALPPPGQPSSHAQATAANGARFVALELVGPHNSAANSPRLGGEAVLKFRLLQARGYMVVPVPVREWERVCGARDVWTKMVYLNAKLERRPGAAAVAPESVAVAQPGMEAEGQEGGSGQAVLSAGVQGRVQA